MSEQPERPELIRVSDADRQRVADLLRSHATDGRLSLDEFSERIGAAFNARTGGELEAVLADLPVASTAPRPAAGRRTRWVVAIMSGANRRGRWRPGRRVSAVSVMGGVNLDFRGATVEGDEIVVTALAVMGAVNITVPEGAEVELTGISFMGAKNARGSNAQHIPGLPRFVVRAFPILGGVEVRARPSRDDGERGGSGRRAHGSGRHGSGGHGAGRGDEPVDDALRLFDGTVTILFSDVAGYTELTEALGDAAAHRLVTEHHAIVRRAVAAHGGHEVKDQGDGLMVAFPSAVRALRCAVDVQRAVAERNAGDGLTPLRVHQGVHTGEAVRQGDDYLGRAVILASRIAGAACGDEILVSDMTAKLASASREFSFGPPRSLTLKGLTVTEVVQPVEWRH
ncbi:MAG TPA: DUF1707 domain-containing protein [Acidimicrobiales bacterium]|nr:DUF1707 domain-containing protein [Acidimicrobiales bacterium]